MGKSDRICASAKAWRSAQHCAVVESCCSIVTGTPMVQTREGGKKRFLETKASQGGLVLLKRQTERSERDAIAAQWTYRRSFLWSCETRSLLP
jgi:hypothetical protein